jgi:hypothetical protein
MSEAASTVTTRYPCVCCGHLTLTAAPGSYDDCPVCGWEDDIVGLRWPDLDGGANRLSLIEAQRSYAATGSADPEREGAPLRPATADEPIEPGFRPVDPVHDNVEFAEAHESPYPTDPTELYWWRPTFWRTPQPADS